MRDCESIARNRKKASAAALEQESKKSSDERWEKVLVRLPTKSNKLLMRWRGPYKSVQKIWQMDYKVDVRGKIKTLHANLLNKYIERDETNCGVLTSLLFL